eukprot:gnl/TRDRNA2_/TRDRNA2_169145_c1_seq1.p1 gnl/TRDRNA2_/TRDRNA2_169145_c1~~gnl/TRDRNA2_/TRDRNA2_169145_c1_seq1.p1  ORF type:complete len:230 (+),score=24.14 gnl/TRDRNA2_/TRDRNA2_169145_c1_seq1:2-691(+)
MMGREYYVPSTMELLEALVMPLRRGQSSMPWLVPLPTEFRGRTFGELMEHWALTNECAVPLGLYRCLFSGEGAFGLARAMGYVMTRPAPDRVLMEGDKVYVLATLDWARQHLGKLLDFDKYGEPTWRQALLKSMGMGGTPEEQNGKMSSGSASAKINGHSNSVNWDEKLTSLEARIDKIIASIEAHKRPVVNSSEAQKVSPRPESTIGGGLSPRTNTGLSRGERPANTV